MSYRKTFGWTLNYADLINTIRKPVLKEKIHLNKRKLVTQNSVATDCREYGIYGISLESDQKNHEKWKQQQLQSQLKQQTGKRCDIIIILLFI